LIRSEPTALPRKEMQAMRALFSYSQKIEDWPLLPLALEKSLNRVVMKNPRKKIVQNSLEPSFHVLGKAIKYDVFLLSDPKFK
jgi:hypothetical protein